MTPDRRTLLAAGLVNLVPGHAAFAKALAVTNSNIEVVELRQYTLKKGRRDELIDLFAREFLEPQNTLGAHVLGTYLDLDDADRFVWLRGFADATHRGVALAAFYEGPVWRAFRSAANDTMLDSDNVLLLRAASGLRDVSQFQRLMRAPLVTAHINYLSDVPPAKFERFFEEHMRRKIMQCGGRPVATFISGELANSFVRLPVRERESTFVWLSAWETEGAHDLFRSRFAAMSGWRDEATEAILSALMRKPEVLRLTPAVAHDLG